MKTIWKYQFSILDYFILSMPEGAEILSVQVQDGIPVLWALVDTNKAPMVRNFRVFGTGNPVVIDQGKTARFVGTIQHEYSLVWHIFEEQL